MTKGRFWNEEREFHVYWDLPSRLGISIQGPVTVWAQTGAQAVRLALRMHGKEEFDVSRARAKPTGQSRPLTDSTMEFKEITP